MNNINEIDKNFQYFLKYDIDKLVKLIQNIIPANLLGIDFLIDCNSRNLVLIDINYFPGYDGNYIYLII